MEEKHAKKPLVWVNGCCECECEAGCSEDAKGFDMTFSIPGVKKDAIKLNVTKSALQLRADRNDIEYVSEMEFECETDPKQVKAHYDNGLLRVHIPEFCPDPFKESHTVPIN